MRKRDIRALRQAKPDLWRGPEDEDGEGDTPDGYPLDYPMELWPQELAEPQEPQEPQP